MKFDDLKKVIKIFEGSNLTYMEFEQEGMRVTLDKRNNAPVVPNVPFVPQVQNMPSNQALEENEAKPEAKDYVTSPLVGTIHLINPANNKPYVSVGSKVKKGDKLCVIEAMKVLNEIKASKDTVIADILVEEGSMVEYSQKLFALGE